MTIVKNKKINVLIVDDSLVFRRFLSLILEKDKEINIVATAEDAFVAKEKILEHHPDVILCDINMPKMNGIDFIIQLLPQYYIPIIIVSSINVNIFEALKIGAIDFICKPTNTDIEREAFSENLIQKIKIASKSKVINKKFESNTKYNELKFDQEKIIAIGASTGGPQAITSILKDIPKGMPPILIVQHIPPNFSRMFAERLDLIINGYKVIEASNNDLIKSATIYIAPGDKHMVVHKAGSNYKIKLLDGSSSDKHCPSVDMLFESVAKVFGENSIGVILTGMGYDGSKGLLSMKRRGAKTIGQNEKTSVVYGMPKASYNLGAVDYQISLDDISKKLIQLLKKDKG